MGAWEDMDGVDIEDMDIPEGSDNASVWVDIGYNQLLINHLETSHLVNIIRGLKSGKSYRGQDWKLPILEKELTLRSK